MSKRQPPKRMLKSREVVTIYKNATDRAASKLMNSMANEHPDVLQNVEFILVSSHRRDAAIDDRAVSEALHACIDETVPCDPLVIDLVDRLQGIRAFREDVSDEVWRDALRVVADSIERHSTLAAGEKGYLSFVSRYVI